MTLGKLVALVTERFPKFRPTHREIPFPSGFGRDTETKKWICGRGHDSDLPLLIPVQEVGFHNNWLFSEVSASASSLFPTTPMPDVKATQVKGRMRAVVKRIFDAPNLIIIAVLVAVGFLLPIIALPIDKAIHQKDEPDDAWIPTILGAKNGEHGVLIGLEAAILALLGGLIACGFISFLLSSAHDSNRANITLGTAFLLAPGLIALGSKQATPEGVMVFAAIVGGFTGMMAGIYRIYDWEGLGWIAFPLDITWGLTGNTVGSLLHVVNIGWGKHATEESERRQNAHRYASGFGFSTFAFTEGNVRSNLNVLETDRLAKHERTHVWQNRFFGPFYIFTYVGWMAVWVVPGVVAGIIKRGLRGIIQGPFSWCYYNNPFETWAYYVQGTGIREALVANADPEIDKSNKSLIWSAPWVIAWLIPFVAITTVPEIIYLVKPVWSEQAPPAQTEKHPPNRPGHHHK